MCSKTVQIPRELTYEGDVNPGLKITVKVKDSSRANQSSNPRTERIIHNLDPKWGDIVYSYRRSHG